MLSLLDTRTLAFASSIISIILVGHMVQLRTARQTYPGFDHWVGAGLATFLALAAMGLRGMAPDLVAVVGGNFFMILFLVLICRGLARFAGLASGLWPDLLIIIVYMALFVWLTYVQPNTAYRIMVFSAAFAYYCLRAALLVFGPVSRLVGSRNWFLAASLLVMAGFFAARGLLYVAKVFQPVDMMIDKGVEALTFLLAFAGLVIVFTGLSFLHTQRMEADLQKARGELHLISGLLPICAHCKRIRDDLGQWEPVEAYVKRHSSADFSHGICPECLRELYPEVAESVLSKTGSSSSQGPT